MQKLSMLELNRLNAEEFKNIEKKPLVVILDNIRSQHNIGAVFRTSDAFLVDCVYLCGITATPPNAEIHKAALGAENTVSWKYCKQTIDAVTELKASGFKIVAVEQARESIMLPSFIADNTQKYALVFGNEVKGVDQEIMNLCDLCIEIPQLGTKHSLNISVSAGILIWEFFKML
jgi:tRNA G18 (ribose-2'-O)-methylase SpoU